MARSKNIFTRVEKKYVITHEQYVNIIDILMKHMRNDEFGESTICSVYFDTPDSRLVRHSVSKPVYKEKLRLRCYNTPGDDSEAFYELKKKYKGIVYKRRIDMTYKEAFDIMNGDKSLPDNQIGKEVKYAFKFYKGLAPSFCMFCERIALFDREDDNLRLTIDRNLRYRTCDFDLRNGSYGLPLLDRDKYVLEVKTAFAMPLWLSRLLDENKIYPSSFSKYGTAYGIELRKHLNEGNSFVAVPDAVKNIDF